MCFRPPVLVRYLDIDFCYIVYAIFCFDRVVCGQ